MKRKLVMQEDDDNKKYESELTNLVKSKDKIIFAMNKEY